MFYLLLFFSSLSTAISNFFIRKSTEARKNFGGDPFLPQRLLSSAFATLIVCLIVKKGFVFDLPMTLLGAVSGVVFGTLMWTQGRSINSGPSSLSFAVINSASVMPPILMAALFGIAYGHAYSSRNALGALLVLIGLFWMGYQKGVTSDKHFRKWLFWISATFFLNIVYLTYFQWRALLMIEGASHPLLPFTSSPEKGDSFVVAMFLVSALMQKFVSKTSFSFSFSDHARWKFGIGGGLFNGLGGYFLVKATELASTEVEKAVLFPLLCILVIFLCNLWGRFVFDEKVKWIASGVCFAGIFISLL